MTITFFALAVGFGLAGGAGFIAGFAVCMWTGYVEINQEVVE